jgi:GH24 family phage-related lysozyme (muramidase)
MVTSTNGINLIKKFEGCRLTAYRCSAGVLTIGYGHTNGVTEGMTITEVQATEFLKSDLKTSENAVNKYSAYDFNQNQFDALVSFTFNCGSGNLSKLTAKGTRTLTEISNALLLYNKANGKKLAGLVKRRQAEKTLFDTPSDTELTIATTCTISTTQCYPAYKGSAQNIDTILQEVGLPSKYYGSFAKRKSYVTKAKIFENYKGTYTQNITLIVYARQGKLPKV